MEGRKVQTARLLTHCVLRQAAQEPQIWPWLHSKEASTRISSQKEIILCQIRPIQWLAHHLQWVASTMTKPSIRPWVTWISSSKIEASQIRWCFWPLATTEPAQLLRARSLSHPTQLTLTCGLGGSQCSQPLCCLDSPYKALADWCLDSVPSERASAQSKSMKWASSWGKHSLLPTKWLTSRVSHQASYQAPSTRTRDTWPQAGLTNGRLWLGKTLWPLELTKDCLKLRLLLSLKMEHSSPQLSCQWSWQASCQSWDCLVSSTCSTKHLQHSQKTQPIFLNTQTSTIRTISSQRKLMMTSKKNQNSKQQCSVLGVTRLSRRKEISWWLDWKLEKLSREVRQLWEYQSPLQSSVKLNWPWVTCLLLLLWLIT